MRENRMIKLTSFVMFLTVIAVVLVTGTYAKYSSSAAGEDTATVAKWDIKAGKAGNELSITGTNATVAFDLFDTIQDTNGATESDVKAGLIAPGTQGAFDLSIKNDSEVNAVYTINYKISGADIPLEFRLNGGEWTDSLASIPSTAIEMGTSATAKVEWRWAFDANDTGDTILGTEASKNVTVNATLVVSQVD